MPRPKKCRWVKQEPGVTFFKPQGIPLRGLEQVVITVDELEAVRLADFLNMSHEEAAQHLKVSRPTVTRMLSRAHQLIADALVHGKAIRIEGGDYTLETCTCPKCEEGWQPRSEGEAKVGCDRCEEPTPQDDK